MQLLSKAGQLAGNHFLTITSGLENLRKLGVATLWEGAQEFVSRIFVSRKPDTMTVHGQISAVS